jgi:acetylornithine deacetylase/succinyl-diaminopimelate desuccinylase
VARIASRVDSVRAISLLENLISVDSSNPPGGEAEVVRVLVDHFRRHGLRPEVYEALPSRPNLSVSVGHGSGRTLLLNAHSDTMPAGGGWSGPPFEPRLVDGLVIGRGACDAKGGLAAMAETILVVAEAGLHDGGRVILDVVADEEGGAAGTKAAIARGREADWAIVAEPTDLSVARASNGQVVVTVSLRGLPAHGSTPDDGVSAIAAAADLILAVEQAHVRLRSAPHPLVGPPSYNVGTMSGGVQASIVPAECRLEIDRRVVPGTSIDAALDDIDALLGHLRGRRPNVEVDREVTLAIPPVAVPGGSPVCRALVAGLRRSGIEVPTVGGLRATSDAAWLAAAGIPTVVFGPGSLAHAHRPDERVAVADVILAADVLVAAATDLLG